MLISMAGTARFRPRYMRVNWWIFLKEYSSLICRKNHCLIHKKSGALLFINGSAAMFVDLHAKNICKR